MLRRRSEPSRLLDEARRILRRRGHYLTLEARDRLARAIEALEAACRGSRAFESAAVTDAARVLDHYLEKDAGFLRKSDFRRTVETYVTVAIISVLLSQMVLQLSKIGSNGMLPTFADLDDILILKVAYGVQIPFAARRILSYAAPARGHVVWFDAPNGTVNRVKRVVAVAGDVVEVKRDRVWINGRPVERRPARSRCDELPTPHSATGGGERGCKTWIEVLDGREYEVVSRGGRGVRAGPLTVPKDHVYVLGDNRTYNDDSRVWGPVDASAVHARIVGLGGSWLPSWLLW